MGRITTITAKIFCLDVAFPWGTADFPGCDGKAAKAGGKGASDGKYYHSFILKKGSNYVEEKIFGSAAGAGHGHFYDSRICFCCRRV